MKFINQPYWDLRRFIYERLKRRGIEITYKEDAMLRQIYYTSKGKHWSFWNWYRRWEKEKMEQKV